MTEDFEGILGTFASADALPPAIRRVREARFTDFEVYLPGGDRETVDTLVPEESPVRWIAAGGGIAGLVLGLWLPIWMSRDYPLVTGGKPIVSLPPFLVIAFETMIWLAVFGALAGFLWRARLPKLTPSSAYRRDLAVDTFGLLIRTARSADEQTHASIVLRDAGALELRSVYREDRGPLGDVP